MVTRFSRSYVRPLEPGQEAFNKFGCASCHSIPSAGYPEYDFFVPLDSIGGDPDNPRPFESDPDLEIEDYIRDSIIDPQEFLAYPVEDTLGPMLEFSVEGHDPDFDESSGVSSSELDAMAEWLAEINNPTP